MATVVPAILPVFSSSFGAVTFIVILRSALFRAASSIAAISSILALRASFSCWRFGRIAILVAPEWWPLAVAAGHDRRMPNNCGNNEVQESRNVTKQGVQCNKAEVRAKWRKAQADLRYTSIIT